MHSLLGKCPHTYSSTLYHDDLSGELMVLLFECAQVRTLADAFLREAQRHYYATPTSYLELIQTYKELLTAKRTSVGPVHHNGALVPLVSNRMDTVHTKVQVEGKLRKACHATLQHKHATWSVC
jgi:hypothetical protein